MASAPARAPAASAAARVPSNARKPQPATSATRSITPLPRAVDQQHLADDAGGSARHQRRQRRDGGLLDPFGWNDHAQHE